jgi:hypothetical protein
MNAAKQPAQKGFPGLRCPLCGTAEYTQTLDLDDLDGLHCAGCGEDYTVDDVRELLASWQRVLEWIDTAPSRDA